jgi:hypothetical protein
VVLEEESVPSRLAGFPMVVRLWEFGLLSTLPFHVFYNKEQYYYSKKNMFNFYKKFYPVTCN